MSIHVVPHSNKKLNLIFYLICSSKCAISKSTRCIKGRDVIIKDSFTYWKTDYKSAQTRQEKQINDKI